YPVAVENNYTGEISTTDPNTATVWELKLRSDVYWHEGYGYRMTNAFHRDILTFDADDVIWYYTTLTSDLPTSRVRCPYVQYLFGTDPAKAYHKVDRFTVQFHLNNLYADLFSVFGPILPQHILDPTYDALGLGAGIRADGTMAPSYTNWDSDDFNYGRRTQGDIRYPATIGTGAYALYPGRTNDLQTIILSKNQNYFKNHDAYWKPIVEHCPDKYVYSCIENKDTAKRALEAGNIDIMDVHYDSSRDYPILKNKPGITAKKQLQWEIQTLGYNILNGGNGKLALYKNKWVRVAISHLIPRQSIVDYILNGLGQPNFAPFPQQSPYWSKNLEPIYYNQSKAYYYMTQAGYDMMVECFPTQNTPAFGFLGFILAMSGMTITVIQYRKLQKKKI
ncbi:MAG: ABC transporter substrate-binding protein, partial [Candidatus Hodarchaeota archaeon]